MCTQAQSKAKVSDVAPEQNVITLHLPWFTSHDEFVKDQGDESMGALLEMVVPGAEVKNHVQCFI